jgi:hypothetical protein
MTSRRWAATLCAAALLPLLAACGGGGGTPNPSGEPGPSGEGEIGQAPQTTPAPPEPGSDYPNTAQAYAEAIIDATWLDPDLDLLFDLTTPVVSEQLVEIPQPLDLDWHFEECRSADPDWVCVFDNDDGDRLALSIRKSLLGEAHAGVEVSLDPTEYPDTAVPYVREFVDAWRGGNEYRMSKLATSAVIGFVDGKTTPASGYLACGDGAAGSTYVRVYGGGGPEYVFQVTNGKLGDPDAITGQITPPDPPACFSILINPSIIFPTIIAPGG